MVPGMRSGGWRRTALALAVLSWVAGACQTPTENPYDSEARLAELMEQYREIRRNGWRCEERKPTVTPFVDCERIRKNLERLAIEFPRDVPVLMANAVIAFETQRYSRSQMYLDRVLALETTHPDAAALRVELAVREGNLRFARRLVDEQIELAPDRGKLREARAAVRYLSGDYLGAERDLEAALALGVPPARVAYHKGLLAEARGHSLEAIDHYGRALELDPGDEKAASRLRALELGIAPDPSRERRP